MRERSLARDHANRADKLASETLPAFVAAGRRHDRQCSSNNHYDPKSRPSGSQNLPESGQLPGPSGRRQALRQVRSIPTAKRLQNGRRPDQSARLVPDLYAEPASARPLDRVRVDSLSNARSVRTLQLVGSADVPRGWPPPKRRVFAEESRARRVVASALIGSELRPLQCRLSRGGLL